MKKYVLFLIIIGISVLVACLTLKKNDSAIEDMSLHFVSIGNEPTEKTYINHVKGHKEKETIVGYFFGKSKDTLRIESSEEEYTFNVVSSNSNIPTLRLENTICPLLVNEGDLDGNGTTEVGILDTWNASSCRLYRIYTLKDNKWCYLIAPLETSESVRASGMELAESTGIKNKIRVRYADFEAPLSSVQVHR